MMKQANSFVSSSIYIVCMGCVLHRWFYEETHVAHNLIMLKYFW